MFNCILKDKNTIVSSPLLFRCHETPLWILFFPLLSLYGKLKAMTNEQANKGKANYLNLQVLHSIKVG